MSSRNTPLRLAPNTLWFIVDIHDGDRAAKLYVKYDDLHQRQALTFFAPNGNPFTTSPPSNNATATLSIGNGMDVTCVITTDVALINVCYRYEKSDATCVCEYYHQVLGMDHSCTFTGFTLSEDMYRKWASTIEKLDFPRNAIEFVIREEENKLTRKQRQIVELREALERHERDYHDIQTTIDEARGHLNTLLAKPLYTNLGAQ